MNFGKGEVRFLRCVSGKTLGSDDGFIRKLKEGIPRLREESNLENCDLILVFCPVVSRPGIDIQSALEKLQDLSESKPAVLVVLHHTFEPEALVPDSSRSVNRENTLTVDCLFHEDRGLLQCSRNQEALKKVTQWINRLVPFVRVSSMPSFRDRFSASNKSTAAENQEKPKPDPVRKKMSECEENNKQLQLKNKVLTKLLQRINTTLNPIISTNQKHLDNRQFQQLSDLHNEVKIHLQITERETTEKGMQEISPGLRLVLLGRSGSVKSAVGNSILKNRETGTSTPTQGYKIRQGNVGGKSLTVLETPDELFSELPQEEIRHCVRLSAPGPHAFLIVLPVMESTGEERGMLEKMGEMFGEMCWRNTIILLTVTDEEQKNRVEEFIRSGNQEVQRLVEKCGNRFHCLNVKENRDNDQVSELLEKIEKMLKDNPERFYSREIYQQIREMERRVMEIVLRRTQKDIQEYEEYITKLDKQIKEVQEGKDVRVNNVDLQAIREKVIRHNKKWIVEKEEMQRRYIQDIKEMKETYDGEGWMKKKKELMKIILPEVHYMLWDLQVQLRKKVKNKQPETQNPNPADLKESITTETDQRTVNNSDSERENRTEETPDNAVQKNPSSANANAVQSSESEDTRSSVSSDLCPDSMSTTEIQPDVQKESSSGNTTTEKSPVVEGAMSGKSTMADGTCSDVSLDTTSTIENQFDDALQKESSSGKANAEKSSEAEDTSSSVSSGQSLDNTSTIKIQPDNVVQREPSNENNKAEDSPVADSASSNVLSDQPADEASTIGIQHIDTDQMEQTNENSNREGSPDPKALCPKDMSDQSSDNMPTIEIQPDALQKEPSSGNTNVEKSPVDEGAMSNIPSSQFPENTTNITNLESSSSENAHAQEIPVSEKPFPNVLSDLSPQNTPTTESQCSDSVQKGPSSKDGEDSPVAEGTTSNVSLDKTPTIEIQPDCRVQKEPPSGKANTEKSSESEDTSSSVSSAQAPDSMSTTEIQRDDKDQNELSNDNAKEEKSPMVEGTSPNVSFFQTPQNTPNISKPESSSNENANAEKELV